MTDQLIIGDKASFDDYEASLATRNIGMPTKKTIKETVPFSNVTYDFSKINGELYWEERELEYVFEMLAPTPERLEELKTAFASWVMNVFKEEIHDPFIPDYHFIGTFDDIDFEDEETLDKTTATVTFKAYPYKIANLPTVIEHHVSAGGTEANVFAIDNKSSHRVKATLDFERVKDQVSDYPIFTIGSTSFTIENKNVSYELWLTPETKHFSITPKNNSYHFAFAFTEEVF